MRKLKISFIVVLLMIISIVLGLAYTNAKYTSQIAGQISASVAKYVFEVSATDTYSSANTIEKLVLAQTCNNNTLINGKIAPGTSRKF